jgi:hypothetical protein
LTAHERIASSKKFGNKEKSCLQEKTH